MPTDTSQQAALKPIMYELGVVVYLCQLFENNLLLLVSLLSANSKNMVTSESFQNAAAVYSEKTLGQIAKIFKEKLSLPNNFVQYIREGVEERNKVTHGFVLRNHENFLTVEGRETMIDDLRQSQHLINERYQTVQTIIDTALQVFGGSLKDLREKQELLFESDNENEKTKH